MQACLVVNLTCDVDKGSLWALGPHFFRSQSVNRRSADSEHRSTLDDCVRATAIQKLFRARSLSAEVGFGEVTPLLQCTFQRLVRVTCRVCSGANKRVLLQAVGLRWCSESDAKPTHLLVRLFHARIQLRFSTAKGARQLLFVCRSPCNRPRSVYYSRTFLCRILDPNNVHPNVLVVALLI